jgi:hypothetical protein
MVNAFVDCPPARVYRVRGDKMIGNLFVARAKFQVFNAAAMMACASALVIL